VDYARRYADRIFGLREGRLVFNGPATELSDDKLVEIFGEFPLPLEPVGEPALTEVPAA
jgi:ABC-type phosphate/phosphonate transport system ATPase subunit